MGSASRSAAFHRESACNAWREVRVRVSVRVRVRVRVRLRLSARARGRQGGLQRLARGDELKVGMQSEAEPGMAHLVRVRVRARLRVRVRPWVQG